MPLKTGDLIELVGDGPRNYAVIWDACWGDAHKIGQALPGELVIFLEDFDEGGRLPHGVGVLVFTRFGIGRVLKNRVPREAVK